MPTARGYALLLAGAIAIAVGLVWGYPEVTVLGCGAVVAVLGSVLWVAPRPSLRVERTVSPDRVMRGEASIATLTVRNTSRWRSASVIGHDRVGTGEVGVPLLRIRSGAETTTNYTLPTERRGVVDVGPLRIGRRDPLDLSRASSAYGDSARLWVHPRIYSMHAVPVGTARSLDGTVDKVAHGNITFHALREYVVGDDLRHVHWRTSAHIGELMVREHVDTSLPRIVVLFDDRRTAHDAESFEHAADSAASVIVAVLHAGLHLDLHFASGTVLSGAAGGQSTNAFLDVLAEAEPSDEDSLTSAAERLRHQRSGDTLFVFTGTGNRSDLDPIASLRDAYPSIVVGVLGSGGMAIGGTTVIGGMTVLTAANAAHFAVVWDGASA